MKSVCKDITKKNSMEIGDRIRNEMKERKISRKDMIAILYPNGEIKSENTISQMCNGKDRHFNLEHIKILAKKWGLREEYLLCVDGFKTMEDMLRDEKDIDVGSLKACLSYLETLGLEFVPCVSSILPLLHIRRYWEILKDCIDEYSRNLILTEYDWSLPYIDFCKKYYRKEETVTWINPLDLDISFDDIGKHSDFFTTDNRIDDIFGSSLYVDGFNSSLKMNVVYNVHYSVFYNNEYKCDCTIEMLQSFIAKLDAFTECAINTILLQDTHYKDCLRNTDY